MPELAEVEFFRKQWRKGLKQRILAVELHAGTRVFRSADTAALGRELTGAALVNSEAHGKQMFFRFSGAVWLGLARMPRRTGDRGPCRAGDDRRARRS